MVKHYYREENQVARFGGDSILKKEPNMSIVKIGQCPQPTMSRNNGTIIVNRGTVEEKAKAKQPSKPPEKKKVVKYKYIDESEESSSEETSSSEGYSTSDSSSYSDYESCPPKRSKKSSSENADHQDRSKTGSKKKKSDANVVVEQEQAVVEEEEYVVEKIVDMKRDRSGKRFFLIKWLNYPSADNTWEPMENLEKCPDMVDEFINEHANNNNNGNHKRKAATQKKCKQDSLITLTKEPRNDLIKDNGLSSESSAIRNAMMSSVKTVIDVNQNDCQSPNIVKEKEDETVSQIDSEYLEEVSKPTATADIYIRIPNAGNIFYLRIIDDNQFNWIFVDMTEPEVDPDIHYKCVVTEDLTGKQPKLIYGATTAVNGDIFCLVQFEGYSYVDVIPPENLFMKFPTFKRFFELQCPHLFGKTSDELIS